MLELYPQFNHKPAMMRAYKAADINRDGWIGRREFRLFLQHLAYFTQLWENFDRIDTRPVSRLPPVRRAQC